MRINTSRGQGSRLQKSAIEESRAHNSNERLIGRNGEINAGNKKELFDRVLELANEIQAGTFNLETAHAPSEILPATAEERREALIAAFNDPNGAAFAELGAAFAAEISNRITRLGFTRRMLGRGEITQGSIARIRTPENNVQAVTSIGPTQIGMEFIRGKYLYPTEFYIVANPRVEMKELMQGTSDLLEEVFLDAQQAVLVQEDRLYLKQILAAANIYNGTTYFTGQLTPAVLAQLQENVNTWGLPISNLMLSMDLIKDINTGAAFNDWLEPVSKLEIILTGRLGTILGMDLSTDGYRDPKLKVLDPGTVIVSTLPENLGAYTDRGPLTAEPRTNDTNTPSKGWFMWEMVSQTIANAKGVAVAKRV